MPLKNPSHRKGKPCLHCRRLKRLLRQDHITNLLNSSSLFSDIQIFNKKKIVFGLVFIDIDDFKAINEEYGHVVGTQLISQFGVLLKDFVGDRGISYRYGGDEFVIVIDKGAIKDFKDYLRSFTEALRHRVWSTIFRAKKGTTCRLTISLGVYINEASDLSAERVVELADASMYAAKKSSKNCVVFHYEKNKASGE